MIHTSTNLLRIDVDQAVRKLSSNRFKSAADALIELIMLAASTGPRCISVKIKPGRVVVDADSGTIDAALFRDTALLFDPNADPEARIESLKNLETASGPSFLAAFLAAFSAPWRRVLAEQRGTYTTGLAFLPNKAPFKYTADSTSKSAMSSNASEQGVSAPCASVSAAAPNGGNGFRIDIEGEMGRSSVVLEVASRCRFSTVPVYVNREQVNRGFHLQRCLIQRPFQTGDACGVVGIPIDGNLSVLYRLKNGIVVEEVALNERRGLILEAAVECGQNDLENRILYDKVRDKGRDLYADAAALYIALKGPEKEALKNRLLQRYEHSFERSLVDGVPLFCLSNRTFVDLFEIKRRADSDDVFGVDESSDLSQFSTANRFVLILSPKERKFLSAALGIHPPSPPRRVPAKTASRLYRRIKQAILDKFCTRGRPVDVNVLTVYEREFLSALKAELPKDFAVAFCNRASLSPPFKTTGKTVIHIPRKHPSTSKMISAVLRDPSYIRFVAALLTRGALPIR